MYFSTWSTNLVDQIVCTFPMGKSIANSIPNPYYDLELYTFANKIVHKSQRCPYTREI